MSEPAPERGTETGTESDTRSGPEFAAESRGGTLAAAAGPRPVGGTARDASTGSGLRAKRPVPLTARQISAREQSRSLFAELSDARTAQSRRADCREELVRMHLPLVDHCARRFINRGEPFDDLVQVGTIGLIKSVDRFDNDRGVEFSTYATPTILGEIKRYFRDKGWAIRVPRRLQELRMAISSITGEMAQDLGRSPTPREIAERLGVSVEEVMEGIESTNAYSTLSLDAGDNGEDGSSTSMLDSLGMDDEALAHVEIRESIKPLIERLPAREKRILMLRFFRGMTQSQIADEIGVSQMHVSRLLNRTLAELRTSLSEVS
jgi:RNA polymerase sigma-B factor